MTPAEAAAVLEASGQAYVNLLRSLTPEAASWRPAPEEWCVNECAGHVIEAERRGFAGRIRLILSQDEPTFELWDQPGVTRARRDCEKAPQDLAEELATLRRESLTMLRAVQPDQLRRAGNHPRVGALSVNDLMHEWVHHDSDHLRQVFGNVEAYVWPDMGNAQRFSKP